MMRDLTASRCAAGHSLLSSFWVSCECREPLADAAVCSLAWDAAATACRADASAFVIGGQQWPSDPTQARQAPPAPRLALAAALRYPSTPMKLYRAFATVGGLTLVS